jgi:hypothetical protein
VLGNEPAGFGGGGGGDDPYGHRALPLSYTCKMIDGPPMAMTSWVIVVGGEAEGRGVQSAPLRAPRREAARRADTALDIRRLPSYAHV